MAPHTPQPLGAPRRSRGTPRYPTSSWGPEMAARRAHGEPRPAQTDGAEQADPRGDRQPGELRAGHRRAEARAGEPRVLGVVALALGGEPEPREPERRHEEHDRPQPRRNEIAPAAVEGEALRAEPHVAGEEPLLAGDEKRVIQPEGERGEHPAADPDADELARGGAQREADAAPRDAAQAVAPRADHGDWDEDGGEDRDGQPGGHDDERRRLQHLRGGVQQRDRQEEEEDGLGESRDQLAARAVIGEAVALELALAPEVAAHARLRPEEVDAGRGENQQRVDHVDAEEGGAGAAEDRVAHARGRRDRERRGQGRRRKRLRRGCRGGRSREGRGPALRSTTHLVERGLIDGDHDAALRTPVAHDLREPAARTRVSHSSPPGAAARGPSRDLGIARAAVPSAITRRPANPAT